MHYLDQNATQGLPGRCITECADPGERVEVISITSKWLQQCCNSHRRCGLREPRPMPGRVVDISAGHEKLRLLKTSPGQLGVYAAISYSWGGAKSSMLRLKKHTQKALESRFKLGDLVKLHQQGIQVAEELGYKYIWIDALCIIQDDIQDWLDQSSLVPQIYGNADITIVAGRSHDARDGFLEPTYAAGVPAAAIPYQSSNSPSPASCWVGPRRNHEIGPANERGWCYQEALVARRMIVYGSQQLSFRCQEAIEFEDGHHQWFAGRADWYDLSSLFRGKPAEYLEPGEDPTDLFPFPAQLDPRQDSTLARWYDITAEYSARSFYNPTDNHAAFSGTVLLFQEVIARRYGRGHEKYMAGLWEMDMVFGLLWRSLRIMDPGLPALTEPKYEGRVVRRAPSWSWMALSGRIIQGTGIDYDGTKLEGLGPLCPTIPGEACCSPSNPGGRTWAPTPDNWGPTMTNCAEFPELFSLQIKAYIRKVRISQYTARDLRLHRRWGAYPEESIFRHTVLLEAEENPPLRKGKDSKVSDVMLALNTAARGLLDKETTAHNSTTLWAMCVTTVEGLLLEQSSRAGQAYKRLGVFIVEDVPAFYPPAAIEMKYDEHVVNIAKLEMVDVELV